jgi:hypothetical protein
MTAQYTTVAGVLDAYGRGERDFDYVRLDHAHLADCGLGDATFIESSFRGAAFERVRLAHAEFTACDLTGASFDGTTLDQVSLTETSLRGARLAGLNTFEATLDGVDATGADLTGANLFLAHLWDTRLTDATLDGVTLGFTTFTAMDLSPFCDAAGLVHHGPSNVDLRSVMRSYRHPGVKRFLMDCGVPPLVAEYTIAAAEAEGDALKSLMRSTFISYGGPDEAFARRLYDELRKHGVTTFFFPETARLGRRIGDEVHSRIQEHDRVILVCSRASLDRPGVRNEIQETFDREARDGGATYLLPIRLDDYVLDGWDDPLAPRVRDRVVGDFSGAMDDDRTFDAAMSRLLAALRKDPG